jgi:hypothetical protein
MWESWAAMLAPTASVSSVSTGAQTVSYSPPSPPGEYGLALARAQWHRDCCSSLCSVPLRVAVV